LFAFQSFIFIVPFTICPKKEIFSHGIGVIFGVVALILLENRSENSFNEELASLLASYFILSKILLFRKL